MVVIEYRFKNGNQRVESFSPDRESFEKWQTNYLHHLETGRGNIVSATLRRATEEEVEKLTRQPKTFAVTYTQTFTVRIQAKTQEEAEDLFERGDFEDYAGTENVQSREILETHEEGAE